MLKTIMDIVKKNVNKPLTKKILRGAFVITNKHSEFMVEASGLEKVRLALRH